MNTVISPGWGQVHEAATVVDLHAHPGLKASLFNRSLKNRFRAGRTFNPLSVRTDVPKLRKGGVDVLLSVIYAPEKQILEQCWALRLLRSLLPRRFTRALDQEYFQLTLEMLNRVEAELADSTRYPPGVRKARVARSPSDLEAILAQGDEAPIAVIHCVEGAHSLEGRLENLDRLSERGVAYLTLAHFFPNEVVHPVFPWPESIQKFGCFQNDERDLTKGLTPFGEQVVEKMLELGMLIDVSHCTPPARRRIYQIVGRRAPMLATHVGAYEINPSPYNLADEEIRRIADSGGMVGVIFMNYWLMPHETRRGLNFISRTLEHFINVGGIDHVGIGTDFDGFTDPPDDLKDASELPRLTQRLLAEGYCPEEVCKILGGNALEVLRAGWRKPAAKPDAVGDIRSRLAS